MSAGGYGSLGTLGFGTEVDTTGLHTGMASAAQITMAGTRQITADLAAMENSSSASMAGTAQAVAKAQLSMSQLERAAQKLKDQIDPLGPANRRLAQDLAVADAMLAKEKISVLEHAKALEFAYQKHDQYTGALRQGVAVSGEVRAGTQQLSYQIGDVAQQFALGTPPMIIFAQQGGQVVQAVQMMRQTSGGFIGFLAGPWGAALMGAAMIVGMLITELMKAEEEMKAVELASDGLATAQGVLGNMFDLTTGKLKNQNEMLRLNAQLMAMNLRNEAMVARSSAEDAMKDAGQHSWGALFSKNIPLRFMFSERDTQAAKLLRDVIDGKVAPDVAQTTAKSWNFSNVDISKNDYMQALSEATSARLKDMTAESVEASLKAGELAANLRKVDESADPAKIDRHAEGLARNAAATDALIAGLFALADAYLVSDAAALKAEITAKATEQGIKKRADVEAYVAQQLKLTVAQRAADAAKTVSDLRSENDARQILNNQIAQGLITADQAQQIMKDEAGLRPYLAAQALAEGEAKEKLTQIIADLRKEQARANEQDLRARDQQATLQKQQQLTLLEQEAKLEKDLGARRIAALTGLNGMALEDELALINLEREKAVILIRAEAEAEQLRKQGLEGAAAATMAIANAQIAQAESAFDYEKQEVAISRVNDQLAVMEQLLQRAGGFAGTLGAMLEGLRTGDFSSMGAIGSLFNMVLNTKDDDTRIDKLANQLEGLFGIDGPLAKTISKGLQSAGTGLAASRTILGDRGLAGDIGAMIGGVAGNAIGNAIAGPIGGKIGEIIFGTIGGFLGGIFGGSKKGTVTFNGEAITGTRYGNDERIEAATKSANSIMGSLDDIAAALGGTVRAGVRGVSIGMHKDEWRVDPTGQGRSKGAGVLNFGDDYEAAALAATKLLIDRGVIAGIRGSTQTLLRAGSDLQVQLQKAIAFEGVFKQLENASNPLMGSIVSLRDEFEQLNEIFREAKATTEELAKLQELQAIRMQQLIDQASANYRSTFWSEAENAAWAKKQIATQMAALGYADVDTVNEYKALVDSIDTTTEEGLRLYGALMNMADLFGTLKDAEQSAADQAAEAAAKIAALAQQRAAMEAELLRLRGDEAGAIAKQRALELEALDPSLRALQEHIYKAQDIAAAKDVLAEAYERESRGIEETIERMGRLGDTLREFRDGLFTTAGGSGSYAQLLARFREIGTKAGFGDEEAMANLPAAGREFLEAAKARAGSAEDYRRAIAMVARMADGAIGAADAGVTVAEEQLAALKAQVGSLISIDEKVTTVAEALAKLAALGTLPGTAEEPARNRVDETEREERADRRQKRLEDLLALSSDRINRNTEINALMLKIFQRVEKDGAFRFIEEAEGAE